VFVCSLSNNEEPAMDQLIIDDPHHPMRVVPVRAWPAHHPVVSGAVIGASWGAVMRAWMRFISNNPEFSWGGTLFIVGAATIVGAVLGLARLRRRSGGVGWWRLSIMSLALLGAGGAVMWPSVVLGGIAFGRPRPRWLRIVLTLGALAVQIPILRGVLDDNVSFALWESAVAVAWYLPMLAAEAWAFSVVFTPAMPGADTPGRVKWTMIGVAVFGVSAAALLAAGLPG
jgi:hypothetical protein